MRIVVKSMLAMLCCVSLLLASAGPSTATSTNDSNEDELAVYLEAIFSGDLIDQNGSFDREEAASRFGMTFVEQIDAELKSLRPSVTAESSRTIDAPLAPAVTKKDSYPACVLKKSGYGGILGASSAIAAKIAEKDWKAAAKLITKQAAKQGIKIGVKGGIFGFAATLAAAGAWCATPWA